MASPSLVLEGPKNMRRIVFFTIHNTTPWWRYIGSQVDFAEVTVLSDHRNDGDRCLVDDFYRFLRRGDAEVVAIDRFGDDGCSEIILRCRTLRSLKNSVALRMIGAMAQAIESAFEEIRPELVLTFTMDRYVMDVMARVASKQGIEFLEITTSIIPEEVMLLRRGRLIKLWDPDEEHVEAATRLLVEANFAPTYVRNLRRFSKFRYWKVFGYFALRAAFFNVKRHVVRDPLNLHYLDSLKRLKHKVRLRDVAVLGLIDHQWERHLALVPKDRRVFFGLQLFPEASMDYWLQSQDMLAHDEIVVRYCEVLGRAGYHIFVKDHPLQFGFRQRGLMTRLSELSSVSLVPYEVSANRLLADCAVSITFTGTIGFQAALAGLCSVVTEPYYATAEHFVHVRDAATIENLPERLAAWRPLEPVAQARLSVVRHLAEGSVPGDYFTWQKFDPEDAEARAKVAPLIRSLNTYLPRFLRRPKEAHRSSKLDA
jgi:hypothetical protein